MEEKKIARLSPEVVNQIAAGEVVENPASVVKELIENSLDAGAKRIEVRIKKGGLSEIRVEDDGCGMGSEDLFLSFERYATSKMRESADLWRLGTMGFRGEALAAIGSISLMEMKSSTGQGGTRVALDGGAIKEKGPCARNRGTTVEVRDLFFNVPARRKFQKSLAASSASVRRVVETIALAHPEVAFSLVSDDNTILQTYAETRKERIEGILGPFAHEVEGEGVWGLIAEPQKASSQKRGQFIYINKRPISSPLLSKAVKEGYGTRLQEKEYPSFVLFLELAPDQVDVNYHPQKKEARFLSESLLFRSVVRAVSSAFKTPSFFSEPISFAPSILPQWNFREEPPVFEPVKNVPLPFVFPEKVLGLFGPYLLLEKEGVILVDLRRARARLMQARVESQFFTWEEGIQIWKELQQCDDPVYDPLGRRIWRVLGAKEWEELLG
jgi:DNA mismatch repair protein MutL